MHQVIRTRSTSRLVLAVVAALALLVAACGSSAATPTSTPSATTAAPAASLELAGTSWRLTRYLSPDGAVFTVPAAVTPLAEFTADQVSGNAGCNTFNGPFTLGAGNATEGQAIELGPLMSTKMACQDPMATVETAYLAALDVVNMAALLQDGSLQLWDSGGKTTLVFIAAG
jgi:heat shock protein HslJ